MTKQAPWYRTFFKRDYYDTFYAPLREGGARPLAPAQTEQQATFIAGALGLAPGARVLDLCCGHGRHSVALSRQGYEVTGLDLSAYHIELAGKAAAEAGVRATFVCDDMRNLPLDPPFDAIINIFSSFGYLESDDEDAAVVARVGRALKPGGRFLIDVNNALGTLRSFQFSTVTRLPDGTLLIEERTYDVLGGRIDSIWTHVSPSGERHEGEIHVRMYTPAEHRRMIEAAGMRVTASYGNFDGSPLALDSRRMILLAEKI
ncbi:MAG: methyltransferase domain-containing protein [Dehalococcoidia bacterium]